MSVVAAGLNAGSRDAQGAPSKVEGRDALEKAAELVQQGKLDEADQQARLALSDPQTRAAAYSVSGAIRLQQRRLKESATLLQEAIRLEPRLLGAHLNLAQVYTLQGQPQLAHRLFERALQLDTGNLTARLALARSAMDNGDYGRSLNLARPVLAAFKRSPDGLSILAADFLELGDRRAAAELANDWARLPDVPEAASIGFALMLVNDGLVPEAIGVLEQAKQNSPLSYELTFNLGGAHLLNRDLGRALAAYDLALTVRPDSTPALRQAATIAERQGELERSLSYWIRAKKLDAEDPEILLGFGRACLKLDLLEDAEPALTKAASIRPREPLYQYTLAAAKVGKRQFEAAQGLLEELVTEQPHDPQLQYALGSVLYTEGHLAEAAAHLRESIRLQPEQLASYHYLALVARDQGGDAAAIEQLEKLLQRYPDHAPSCEALGELLMTAQRYSESEVNLRKAVRLNPKSVKGNYQLGLVLARMGKKDEADRQLELAKSLREEDDATSRLQLRLLDPGPAGP
jgi:tetratricopeptide (TPR) repeat protein